MGHFATWTTLVAGAITEPNAPSCRRGVGNPIECQCDTASMFYPLVGEWRAPRVVLAMRL
jgi:hypothetical protein